MKRTIIAALAAMASTGAFAQGNYFDQFDPVPVAEQRTLEPGERAAAAKAKEVGDMLDRAEAAWVQLMERLAEISIPQHGGTANVIHHCDQSGCMTNVLALVDGTPIGATQITPVRAAQTRVVCRFSRDYSVKLCTDYDTGKQDVLKKIDSHWIVVIEGR